jgi:hypothetical protein
MMTEPLAVGVGPAELTEALRRASALADQASVREITVENARSTILSRIFRLRLTYDRITPDAPNSVVLKTGFPSASAADGTRADKRSHSIPRLPQPWRCRSSDRCLPLHAGTESLRTRRWRKPDSNHWSREGEDA